MWGTELGRYRLLDEIGSGGMGRVFRGQVTTPSDTLAEGAVVALKVVHPHLLTKEGFLPRFLREAAIGQRIDHPNVVRTYDVEEAETAQGSCHFLAMEYVEGQTLRQLLDEMTRVPEALCRHIGREIARALSAIHDAGVVHRDLKPENVLITPEHEVKVMDLGVALLADAAVRISQTGVFVGSVEYAAPEQIRGSEDVLDGRADLHALGAILYELATSTHPFRADHMPAVMRKILEDEPRRCGELNPQVSAFYENLVHCLLEKDPDRRVASAAEVSSILSEGEGGAWWTARAQALRDETRRSLRRIRMPRATDIYGRENELAMLRRLYDDACAGEGRVLFLQGEPGVGKTRLIDEFVASLGDERESPHFLYGAYPPGGGGTWDGALSAAYREHFGTEGLEQRLPPYLAATPSLVPSFAALLRGDAPPPDAPSLTEDSLQTAFVQTSHALAAERPTIILVDDIHRAPQGSVALFTALARAAAGQRILLVGTREEGASQSWASELIRLPHVHSLLLSRLGPKALTRLLFEAVGSERLAHELAGHIALKTDGNPFFVFEVIQMLREESTLRRAVDGSWTLEGTIGEIRIPSSVYDLVQARIGRLDASDRDLLEVASCLGVEFDPVLVGRVLGEPTLPTLRRFAQIEREHRLVRSSGRGMVFDHPTVQQALYEGLFLPLREQYHGMIVDVLHAEESRDSGSGGGDGGRHAALVYEHALRGAREALAREFLSPAIHHLLAGHLREKAADLLEESLAQPGLLTSENRLAVLIRLSPILGFLGRNVRRGEVVEEAVALLQDVQDPTAEGFVYRELGLHQWHIGQLTEAEASLRRALEREEAAECRSAIAGTGALLALVLHARGRYEEAQRLLEADLAYRRETDDLDGQASSLTNLGLVGRATADYERARTMFEEAYDCAVRSKNKEWQANAVSNLGGVCYALGQWDAAYDHAQAHRDLAREVGHRRGEAVAQSSLALLAFARGRYGEALRCHEDAGRLFTEIGDAPSLARSLGNMALVLHALGRVEKALETHDRQMQLAVETQDVTSAILGRLHRAAPLLTLGRKDEARATVEEALAQAKEVGRRRQVCECLFELGRMRLASGPSREGLDRVREAVGQAEELGVPNVHLMGSLELARQGDLETEAAEALVDERLDQLERHEQMQVEYLLHELTGSRDRLGRAASILRELGEGAPLADREPMLARVPLYRRIHEAAAALREEAGHGDD